MRIGLKTILDKEHFISKALRLMENGNMVMVVLIMLII